MTLSVSSKEPPSKKRRLRKGTNSCWECKRRKAKCIFTATGGVCVGCHNRGTDCVSQEEEDVGPDAASTASDRRLQRVESLLEALLEKKSVQDTSSIQAARETLTAKAYVSNSRPPASEVEIAVLEPKQPPMPQILSTTLTETLRSLLPSTEQCRLICESARFVNCFFLQLLTRNYLALSASSHKRVSTEIRMSEPPSDETQPILLAQRLLMLACLSQYSSGDSKQDETRWKALSQSMATAAIELVNTKDHLVRNAEGLECLMLETTYHYNNGDLRQAFTTVRRAMALAQLLGIHRSLHQPIQQVDDASPQFDPRYMWYRIVYIDRLLCLVLGVPQGSLDASFANTIATVSPPVEERLERQHCVLASQILNRNEHDGETWTITESIDKSLQDIASSLPDSWWLTPTLSQIDTQPDIFYATSRLVNQLFHFNLLNQTHLPYIFRPVDPLSTTAMNATTPANHGYSKLLCWTSSREILTRYLIFEASAFVAHAYTFVDFFTLIAAVTITLLHIDHHWQSHQSKHAETSSLPHMRSNDRANVERVLQHMRGKPTSSTHSSGPKILQELLAVEEEAFQYRSVGSGVIVKDENADERPFFEIKIPYYGVFRLSSRKICFHKGGEFEDVKTSVRVLAEEDCQDQMVAEDSADAVLDHWTSGEVMTGFEDGDFGGLEMAFFDSIQGFTNHGDIE